MPTSKREAVNGAVGQLVPFTWRTAHMPSCPTQVVSVGQVWARKMSLRSFLPGLTCSRRGMQSLPRASVIGDTEFLIGVVGGCEPRLGQRPRCARILCWERCLNTHTQAVSATGGDNPPAPTLGQQSWGQAAPTCPKQKSARSQKQPGGCLALSPSCMRSRKNKTFTPQTPIPKQPCRAVGKVGRNLRV